MRLPSPRCSHRQGPSGRASSPRRLLSLLLTVPACLQTDQTGPTPSGGNQSTPSVGPGRRRAPRWGPVGPVNPARLTWPVLGINVRRGQGPLPNALITSSPPRPSLLFTPWDVGSPVRGALHRGSGGCDSCSDFPHPSQTFIYLLEHSTDCPAGPSTFWPP